MFVEKTRVYSIPKPQASRYNVRHINMVVSLPTANGS